MFTYLLFTLEISDAPSRNPRSLTDYVTVGSSLNVLGPQFTHLEGGESSSCLLALKLWDSLQDCQGEFELPPGTRSELEKYHVIVCSYKPFQNGQGYAKSDVYV